MIDLEKNLHTVHQRIRVAAGRAGRNPDDITLVAISKTFPVETVLAAHALGVRHFGENRVEEAAKKIPLLKQQLQTTQPLTWHMVGHLQHRKVRDAAVLFDWVHSVDSSRLAQRLNDRASALGKNIPILLEVNVSGEANKFGFAFEPLENFFDAVREILALRYLDTQGLMTLAPIVPNAAGARPYFRALRELRDQLRARFPDHVWQHLSMGMSDDFETAIAEGATIVRIGRAIFGERR
jgi:pyridoxal phosphate enzyme (YggS family)